MIGKLAGAVVRRLPYSRGLLSACRLYEARFSGDNNGDPQTNGEFALARRYLPRCRVAFDVGANVGEWSRYALSVNPSLHLHCFEPVQSTFEKLRASGFPPHVTLNHCGLSSEAGTVEIHRYADPGFNTLHARNLRDAVGGEAIGPEAIRLDTFDRYREERRIDRVDFVKVDVEGHELSVFMGMRESLAAKRVGLIQFEYGGTFLAAGRSLKDVFAFFAPFGGAMYKITPRELWRVPAYHPALDTYQYQNWLVVLDGTDAGALR